MARGQLKSGHLETLSVKALWGSWTHGLCVVLWGLVMEVWHNNDNDNGDVCTRALAMVCCQTAAESGGLYFISFPIFLLNATFF